MMSSTLFSLQTLAEQSRWRPKLGQRRWYSVRIERKKAPATKNIHLQPSSGQQHTTSNCQAVQRRRWSRRPDYRRAPTMFGAAASSRAACSTTGACLPNNEPKSNHLNEPSTACTSPVWTANSKCGRRAAMLCVTRWHTRMKKTTSMKTMERRRKLGDANTLADEVERRSRMDGFWGAARKAIEKSCVDDGDEGVTMMAGRWDFSVTRGKERSSGAGISLKSVRWGKRCTRGPERDMVYKGRTRRTATITAACNEGKVTGCEGWLRGGP